MEETEGEHDHESFERVLVEVKKNGLFLEEVSNKDLKKNRIIVTEAVKQNGISLKFASEDLRDDHEIVSLAVLQNGKSLKFASDRLKRDIDIAVSSISKFSELYTIQPVEKRDMVFSGGFYHIDKDLAKEQEFLDLVIPINFVLVLTVIMDQLGNGKGELTLEKLIPIFEKNPLHITKPYVCVNINLEKLNVEKEGVKLMKEVILYLSQFHRTSFLSGVTKTDLSNDKEFLLEAIEKNGRVMHCFHDFLVIDKLFGPFMHNTNQIKNCEIGKDKDFVMKAVSLDGRCLEFVDKDLKNDREVVLAAVTRHGASIEFASEELKKDKEIVMTSIRRHNSALKYAQSIELEELGLTRGNFEVINDREKLLSVVQKDGLMLQLGELKFMSDKEIVLAAVLEDGRALEFASEDLKNDFIVVINAVSRQGIALQFASDEMKRNHDVLLHAVSENPLALQFVVDRSLITTSNIFPVLVDICLKTSNSLQTIQTIMEFENMKIPNSPSKESVSFQIFTIEKVLQKLEKPEDQKKHIMDLLEKLPTYWMLIFERNTFTSEDRIFEQMHDELKNDKEFVLSIGSLSVAKFVGERLRSDENFIIEFAKKTPECISHLQGCEALKKKEFVMKLVSSVPETLQYISNEFRCDRDVAKIAISKSSHVFEFVGDELKKDEELGVMAINREGYWSDINLELLHPSLFENIEFVKNAITVNENVLKRASEEIKDTKDLVLLAMKKCGLSLEFASERLRGDRDVVIAACSERGNSLQFASPNFRNDKEIVSIAVERNANSWRDKSFTFASDELRNNEEFVLSLMKKHFYHSTSSSLYSGVGDGLKNSTDFWLKCLEEIGVTDGLMESTKKFLEDKSFAIDAVKIRASVLEYLPESLKNDKDVVIESVRKDGRSLQWAGDIMKSDHEVIHAAVFENRISYRYIPDDLKNDRSFLLSLVNENWRVMEEKDERLESKEIILQAITKEARSFQYIRPSLQESLLENEEFLFKAITRNPAVSVEIQRLSRRGDQTPLYSQKFRSKEFVVRVIKANPEAVRYDVLYGFGSVGMSVFDCISVNEECFIHVENDVKTNPEFIIQALNVNEGVFQYLKHSDRDLMISVLQHKPELYQKAHFFKDQPEFAIEIVSKNEDAIKYLSERQLSDRNLMFSLVKRNHLLLPNVKHFKNDHSFLLSLLKEAGMKIWTAVIGKDESEWWSDREFMKKVIELFTIFDEDIISKFDDDESFLMEALKVNGKRLGMMSEKNRKNREMVLTAVKQNGKALRFADSELTKDEEICRIAVSNRVDSFTFVDNSLKDKKSIKEALIQGLTVDIRYYFDEKRNNRYLIIIEEEEEEEREVHVPEEERPYLADKFRRRRDVYFELGKFVESLQDELVVCALLISQVSRNKVSIFQKAFEQLFNEKIENWAPFNFFEREFNNKNSEDSVILSEDELEKHHNSLKRVFEKEMTKDFSDFYRTKVDCDFEFSFLINSTEAKEEIQRVYESLRDKFIDSITLLFHEPDRKVSHTFLGISVEDKRQPKLLSQDDKRFIRNGYGIEFRVRKKGVINRKTVYERRFFGRFKDGKREGYGSIYEPYTQRILFEGNFKNSQKDGVGKEFGLDNNSFPIVIYQGNYKEGQKNGEGQFYNVQSEEYIRGVWKMGRLKKTYLKYECKFWKFDELKKSMAKKNCVAIGRGAYGDVFQVPSSCIPNFKDLDDLKGHKYVAVKRFSKSQTSVLHKKSFLISDIRRSMELIARLEDKRFISKIFGVFVGFRDVAYVMESCKTSIDKVIEAANFEMDFSEKMKILLETAQGMKVLHDVNIMHRDLKWSNVLLDNSGHIKITDFDTIKEDSSSWKWSVEHTTTGRGTAAFNAPERFDSGYKLPIDVFSFGLMIYCLIFEVNNPYSFQYQCGVCQSLVRTMNPLKLQSCIRYHNLRPLLDESRVNQIASDYRFILPLMTLCWEKEPSRRPTFTEIVNIFEKESQSFTIFSVIVKYDPQQQQEGTKKKKKKKKDKDVVVYRVLVMRPNLKNLRKLIEKKLLGCVVVKMESERLGGELRSDDDVSRIVKLDYEPRITVELLKTNDLKNKEHRKLEGEEVEGEGEESDDDGDDEIIEENKNKNDDDDVLLQSLAIFESQVKDLEKENEILKIEKDGWKKEYDKVEKEKLELLEREKKRDLVFEREKKELLERIKELEDQMKKREKEESYDHREFFRFDRDLENDDDDDDDVEPVYVKM